MPDTVLVSKVVHSRMRSLPVTNIKKFECSKHAIFNCHHCGKLIGVVKRTNIVEFDKMWDYTVCDDCLSIYYDRLVDKGWFNNA